MRHTLSRIHKANAGMSTILGMLIFIGVLFTCVIPLFLYVNEVNNMYNRTVVEMKNFDEDKERERNDVYVYPLSQNSEDISVYVKNWSPLSLEIVRVWINDQYFDYSLQIPGMVWDITEPINIKGMLPQTQGETKTFYAKVTTARGNTFSSLTNPLYCTRTTEDEVTWSGSGFLSINIIITREHQGGDDFIIRVTRDDGSVICDDYQVKMRGQTKSFFKKVDVPNLGTYSVTVTHYIKGIICNEPVPITWETPSQWIYASLPE